MIAVSLNWWFQVFETKYEFDQLKLFRDLAYAAAKQDIKERREKRKAALEEQKLKQQATVCRTDRML